LAKLLFEGAEFNFLPAAGVAPGLFACPEFFFREPRKKWAAGGIVETILGHEDLQTTMIYVTLSPENLNKEKRIVTF